MIHLYKQFVSVLCSVLISILFKSQEPASASLNMKLKNNDPGEMQEFLDRGQYSKHGLDKYEWIFGETFLSTGGAATTKEVLKHVNLGRNAKVLDLGSGLGGHSFLIAEMYDSEVIGLDLSTNMMDIAVEHLERRPHLKNRVTFEIKDYTTCEFLENTFDLVYSRDSFLHIADKPNLIKKILKWLKPNGHILFTDYVRGEDETKYSEEFKEYLKKRGYSMATISEYKTVLENSGFKDVQVRDWKEQFKNALQAELDMLHEKRAEFLNNFTEQDYADLELGWAKKIGRADAGYQSWVLGLGRKSV